MCVYFPAWRGRREKTEWVLRGEPKGRGAFGHVLAVLGPQEPDGEPESAAHEPAAENDALQGIVRSRAVAQATRKRVVPGHDNDKGDENNFMLRKEQGKKNDCSACIIHRHFQKTILGKRNKVFFFFFL